MMVDVEIGEAEIERRIRDEAVRIEAGRAAFVPMGQGLRMFDLFAYDDADFIRLAFAAILGRQPSIAEMAVESIWLRSGAAKPQLLSRLRFSAEGRHQPDPVPRYKLWLLHLQYRLQGKKNLC